MVKEKIKKKFTRIFLHTLWTTAPFPVSSGQRHRGVFLGGLNTRVAATIAMHFYNWGCPQDSAGKKREGKKWFPLPLFDMQGAVFLVLWLKTVGFCCQRSIYYFRIWVTARRQKGKIIILISTMGYYAGFDFCLQSACSCLHFRFLRWLPSLSRDFIVISGRHGPTQLASNYFK